MTGSQNMDKKTRGVLKNEEIGTKLGGREGVCGQNKRDEKAEKKPAKWP